MPPGFIRAIRAYMEGGLGAFFTPQGYAPDGFLPTGIFGFLWGFIGAGNLPPFDAEAEGEGVNFYEAPPDGFYTCSRGSAEVLEAVDAALILGATYAGCCNEICCNDDGMTSWV